MEKLLIAFEGIDGSGKWTQLNLVRGFIGKRGYHTVQITEPTCGELSIGVLGKTIKHMLGGDLQKPKNPMDFQRIYVLERGEHCVCFIGPYLKEGKSNQGNFVSPLRTDKKRACLMERFAQSTVAYGMLSGKSIKTFIDLHKKVLGSLMIWPDLNIILDISAEKAMRRIQERSQEKKNKIEYFEKLSLLKKVRKNYLSIAEHPFFKSSTVVINGEQNKEKVFKEVKSALMPFLS